MNRGAVHEFVARTYDPQQPIIASAQRTAFRQLVEHLDRRQGLVRVLELGVGTGHLLERLAQLPVRFEFTGVDVSAGMLERAARRVPMQQVHCSVQDLPSHLVGHTYDLVIAHFLLAYIPLEALLRIVEPLLASEGAISVVTSTNEPLADPNNDLFEQIRRHEGSWNPVRRACARKMQRGLDHNCTPDDIEAIATALDRHRLQIQHRDRATFDLALHGPADAHKFCVQEGWFANALPTRGLSLPVVEPVIRLLFELGEYPVRWTHVIESVLAQHQPPPPTPHM